MKLLFLAPRASKFMAVIFVVFSIQNALAGHLVFETEDGKPRPIPDGQYKEFTIHDTSIKIGQYVYEYDHGHGYFSDVILQDRVIGIWRNDRDFYYLMDYSRDGDFQFHKDKLHIYEDAYRFGSIGSRATKIICYCRPLGEEAL